MENQPIKIDLYSAIEYIRKKRNNEIEHLTNILKQEDNEEMLTKQLQIITKTYKILKSLEDAYTILQIVEIKKLNK